MLYQLIVPKSITEVKRASVFDFQKLAVFTNTLR
jgi:hypothetical protein